MIDKIEHGSSPTPDEGTKYERGKDNLKNVHNLDG